MNFDKTNIHEQDEDYGHFCVLEDNSYMNNYHQKVYVHNNEGCVALYDYDKPSLYPVDYYYDDSIRLTIPVKIEKEKTKMIQMSNPRRNYNNHKNDDGGDDDDDNHKGSHDKIFMIFAQLCIFSMFVSTVVIIMMR